MVNDELDNYSARVSSQNGSNVTYNYSASNSSVYSDPCFSGISYEYKYQLDLSLTDNCKVQYFNEAVTNPVTDLFTGTWLSLNPVDYTTPANNTDGVGLLNVSDIIPQNLFE